MIDEYVNKDYCATTNGDKLDAKPTEAEDTSASNNNVSFTTQKIVTYMPTERNAMEYNMNHKFRGKAIIFNHEHFDIPSLKSRAGTNVDCNGLSAALKKLHFDVEVHKDCKILELFNVINKVSLLDHTDNDCLIIAILSHGELGYLYAKDVQYKVTSIWHYFTADKCKSLAGKPKIFFIQACQGDRLDPGVLMHRMHKTETDGDASSFTIPIHADFLFAYSTIPGFFSWRNVTNGSWFIQALVKQLNENAKKYDILTLLTFVNQSVAFDYESNVPDSTLMHQQKQIPCVTTMLTRILRFADKNGTGG